MRVLVTGANGHIGRNLCQALIDRGHSVRASVRSLADGSKTGPVRALGPIEVVEVDLFRPAQLRAALEGVEVFFHLAAVYEYVVRRGHEEDVVRASVEGAANALQAAADARVHKVVMTSSVVTLPLTASGAPPATERDWASDLRVPYIRAKTLAEQRAWELARSLRLHLVTVLPGAVCGPGFLRPTPSIDVFEGILKGTMRLGVPDGNFPYVDIRDVVAAHVLVGERDCEGRFIACNDRLPAFRELVERLREIEPSLPASRMTIPGAFAPALPFFDWVTHKLTGSPRVMTPELAATLRGRIWNASNARIRRELGWEQGVAIETSLREMVQAIRRPAVPFASAGVR